MCKKKGLSESEIPSRPHSIEAHVILGYTLAILYRLKIRFGRTQAPKMTVEKETHHDYPLR